MGFRILRCSHCGNTIVFLEDTAITPVCCGEKMERLEPNRTDASAEKHVPVIIPEREKISPDSCVGSRSSKLGSCASYATVKVGSSPHPMTDDHYIQWIMLKTNLGTYIKYMEPGDAPETCFCLTRGETVENAYVFCNLHGLWINS